MLAKRTHQRKNSIARRTPSWSRNGRSSAIRKSSRPIAESFDRSSVTRMNCESLDTLTSHSATKYPVIKSWRCRSLCRKFWNTAGSRMATTNRAGPTYMRFSPASMKEHKLTYRRSMMSTCRANSSNFSPSWSYNMERPQVRMIGSSSRNEQVVCTTFPSPKWSTRCWSERRRSLTSGSRTRLMLTRMRLSNTNFHQVTMKTIKIWAKKVK